MFRAILILFMLLFIGGTIAHAEKASVLLKKYGISIDDPVIENAKLILVEDDYSTALFAVNSNEMLSVAYGLHGRNYETKLAAFDLDLYNIDDELRQTELLMDRSKEQSVSYVLELDAKYRTLLAKQDSIRNAREALAEQTQPTKIVTSENIEQDKLRMEQLGKQVETQRKRYEKSLDNPDLGYIENFKSPLEIPIRVTSPYGIRLDPITRDAMTFHKGMDIAAPEGTYVLAAFNGVVEAASENESIGHYVIVNHGRGIMTLYGHLSESLVEKGQRVKQYDVIAKSGGTGSRSTGPHLHFGVYINGSAVDPGVFIANGEGVSE
ncbi:M23 family metallopeptidase [Cohnella cholangitidis]|uniref:M23 family metallopeptidase n=1 Tax=Cohnella cholangitidis TaxID=2598458 RepID=A0A7G5BU61_9BACL|nr:M23 family metallopeptidase [Cohnella cholangitidis]QMV40495.1 M23 family metallopeptidase [Cohnella cholangitidis]